MGSALLLPPSDRWGGRGVAELHGEQFGLHEARAHIEQPVGRDGPRHDREAEHAVAHLPEFFPRGRVVAVEPVGRRRDEHLPPAKAEHHRRAVGLLELGVAAEFAAAGGLPGQLPGGCVEGDDGLRVAPVAVEDQLVMPEQGSAAGAILVVEPLVAVFPDHRRCCGVDARGAEVAEVAVEPAGSENRRGRGVGVERVDRLRVGDDQQFDVVQEFPRIAVHAEGMQRHRSRHIERLTRLDALESLLLLLLGDFRLDRRGHPDLAAIDHRRRPAPAGDRRLPDNVLSFAPDDR